MIINIYILAIIIFSGFILSKIKRDNINAVTIFSFFILFAYLIVPVLVFYLGDGYQSKYVILGQIYESNDLERIKALISIFMFIASTLLFYYNFLPKINNSILNDVKANEEMIYRIIKKYWFILFGIGIVAFIIVIYKFGGIRNYVYSSGGSRGNGDNLLIETGSIFAYANILSRALLGCVYLLILMYDIKHKKRTLIGIILLICLDTVLLIYNAGKLDAIIFYMPILIYLTNKYIRKNKLLIYSLLALITFYSIPKMDDLFYYLNNGVTLSSYNQNWSFIENLMGLINQFTYPYSNLVLSDKMNSIYGFRFGIDYIAPIVNLIPARFLNMIGLSKIEALYHITTDYYQTYVLGFPLAAGVPNDLLTVAFRQLSYLGVIISGSILGIFLAYIDVGIKCLNKMGNQYKQLALINCMAIIAILFIEPNSVTLEYFPVLLSLFLTRSLLKQGNESLVVSENDKSHCRQCLEEKGLKESQMMGG
jgi:hypothetical protein